MRSISAGIAAVTFIVVTQHLPAADAIPAIDESKYVLPGAEFKTPDWVERRKGAPFPVKEFLERPIDPSKNAAPLYIYALSRYFKEFEYLYPEGDRASYLAQVEEFENKIAKVFASEALLENANTPEIQALLKEAAPLLKMIDQAQARPECLFITGLDVNPPLFQVQSGRSIARLDTIQIASACERGDLQTAEHSIQRSLRLARDISPRGPMITQLVAMAINATILNAIQQYYLPSEKLSTEDCDRILKILRHHDEASLDMYAEGLRTDYVLVGNMYDELESGKLSPKILETYIPSTWTLNFDLEWKTLNDLFEKLLKASGDYTRIYETSKEIGQDLIRMKKELDESNTSVFGTIGRVTGITKPSTSFFAPLLFPPIGQFSESIFRNQTRLNGLQMAIAVRRYQLVHGKLPDSLDLAAKEAGYEEALIDPYDGQKLRFVVLDGQPIVYSIGKDRIDQGGKADWEFGKEPGDFLFTVPQPKTP
ncbi:hypothetical protein [Planctomicrobium sp. SH527]|uniref:hypothetical protein n=1 Tax=Planctomicrobium sp. SH527 TaxID=3448123 RepID=UPI003F5C7EB5